MNKQLENVIKDRFKLTTVKLEHLRSSASYEAALDLAHRLQWDALEDLLKKIQIITNRVDKRPVVK